MRWPSHRRATRGGLRVLAGLITLRRGDFAAAADLAVAARASIRAAKHTGSEAAVLAAAGAVGDRVAGRRSAVSADAVAGAGDAATFRARHYPRYSWPVLVAAAGLRRGCPAARRP